MIVKTILQNSTALGNLTSLLPHGDGLGHFIQHIALIHVNLGRIMHAHFPQDNVTGRTQPCNDRCDRRHFRLIFHLVGSIITIASSIIPKHIRKKIIHGIFYIVSAGTGLRLLIGLQLFLIGLNILGKLLTLLLDNLHLRLCIRLFLRLGLVFDHSLHLLGRLLTLLALLLDNLHLRLCIRLFLRLGLVFDHSLHLLGRLLTLLTLLLDNLHLRLCIRLFLRLGLVFDHSLHLLGRLLTLLALLLDNLHLRLCIRFRLKCTLWQFGFSCMLFCNVTSDRGLYRIRSCDNRCCLLHRLLLGKCSNSFQRGRWLRFR